MIFNPWRRQEPLDHTELARLLPAPGDPVLSEDRQHLLEDFLMSNVTQDARPARPRRRLAVRLAAPVALAACLAGTVLAVHQTTPPTAFPVTATDRAATGNLPQQISTVAYTLNRDRRGTVKVTIREAGTQPDLPQLQRDLERMGVPARVYRDDPTCPLDKGEDPELGYATLKAIGFHHRNGAITASIHPSQIPAGTHLEILFPRPAKGYADAFAFGLRTGKAPDCRHAFVSDDELPTPTATFEGEIIPGHRN
ncbi:hypothetical protein KV205_31430 [Streptomyces sp. SKN60]|uniref:hypothetical protein n=1 Tax=Streptomyces sp. SKN60 TaxID=2855506 RepID=UPI0022454344|nr:hypothetical protein [Streptomyces sp. SKN60]MCX2185001.1 hypothetical protein [Streptomyces sp. SKN60]